MKDISAFPTELQNGMTLRDWFAGQALAGLGSQQDENGISTYGFASDIAHESYQIADAMLAERDK